MAASEIDSEELERLEELAEEEEELDDAKLQVLVDAAEAEFPEARIKLLVKDLQEVGIAGWLAKHVVGTPFDVGSCRRRVFDRYQACV